MGQAKLRGTLAERQQQGREKAEKLELERQQQREHRMLSMTPEERSRYRNARVKTGMLISMAAGLVSSVGALGATNFKGK